MYLTNPGLLTLNKCHEWFDVTVIKLCLRNREYTVMLIGDATYIK